MPENKTTAFVGAGAAWVTALGNVRLSQSCLRRGGRLGCIWEQYPFDRAQSSPPPWLWSGSKEIASVEALCREVRSKCRGLLFFLPPPPPPPTLGISGGWFHLCSNDRLAHPVIKCRLLSPPPLGAFQNKITHTHVSSGLAFPTMHRYLQLCRPAVCRLASPSASPGLELWAYYSSGAAPENDRRGRKIQTYRPSSDCHTRCIRQRWSWAHQRFVSAPEKKKERDHSWSHPPCSWTCHGSHCRSRSNRRGWHHYSHATLAVPSSLGAPLCVHMFPSLLTGPSAPFQDLSHWLSLTYALSLFLLMLLNWSLFSCFKTHLLQEKWTHPIGCTSLIRTEWAGSTLRDHSVSSSFYRWKNGGRERKEDLKVMGDI